MKDKKLAYEVVVMFNPQAPEEDKETSFKKIEAWLAEKDTKVTNKDHMGQKTLVYPIKSNEKGDFWLLTTEGEKPIKLNDFNVLLNREVSIIRYLVLKK